MECVKAWLTSLGLQNYAGNFEKYGWDIMDGLHLMTEEDILKVIGDGEKSGYIKRLKVAVTKLQEEKQRGEEAISEVAGSSIKAPADGKAIRYVQPSKFSRFFFPIPFEFINFFLNCSRVIFENISILQLSYLQVIFAKMVKF